MTPEWAVTCWLKGNAVIPETLQCEMPTTLHEGHMWITQQSVRRLGPSPLITKQVAQGEMRAKHQPLPPPPPPQNQWWQRSCQSVRGKKKSRNRYVSSFCQARGPKSANSWQRSSVLSRLFLHLARDYDFTHLTSPNFAQSNGEAEKAVKTVKGLRKKNTETHTELRELTACHTPAMANELYCLFIYI